MSDWQSSGGPSTPNQRIFVVGLLLLAFILCCVVILRIDPRAANLRRQTPIDSRLEFTTGAKSR